MSISVLHVTQPTEAGVAVCARDLAIDQAARSWRVAVASPAGGELEGWLRNAGIEHRRWEATRAPGLPVIAEVRRLRRIIESFDPDVVHLHSSKAGLAGRWGRARRGRAVVFQPHAWSFLAVGGPVGRASLSWERFAASRADVIVCVSAAERDLARAHGVDGRMKIVPNGVDLSRWRAADARRQVAARRSLGIDADAVVVCVGRLSRQKGQDVLLSAWERIEQEVPAARLFLIGDGPERESLRARSGRGVVFAGSRDDVDSWFAAANVVVVSSRWEGMSLAMLEAMASARPVVSTDVPGAKEALAEGCGVVVPVEDPHALAEAVSLRLRDRRLAEVEGERARRTIESRYDLRKTTASAARLYEELLAQENR